VKPVRFLFNRDGFHRDVHNDHNDFLEYLKVAFSGRLFWVRATFLLFYHYIWRFYLKKFFQPDAIYGIEVN
jgi:hypothetical protein